MQIAIGAIIGCATCYFLLDILGLINYERVLKLIDEYTFIHKPSFSTEKNLEKKVTPEVLQTDTKFCKKDVIRDKPHHSLRRIKRVLFKIESREKSCEIPLNSPIIGEKEPLWTHRYSAKLQAAMSNIYEAWREGDDNGWFVSSSHDSGLKILQKKRNAALNIIKGSILIPYPLSIIMAEINNKETKLKWEDNIEDYKELKKYRKSSGIGWTLFKTPSPLVLPRDLVLVYGSCLTEKNGNVVLFPCTSVVFDMCPPKSGKIRAEVHFSGWVLEVLSSNSTMATYIVDIDLKASLPNWVVEQFSENEGRKPWNLFKFIKEKHGHLGTPPKSLEINRECSGVNSGYDDNILPDNDDNKSDSESDTTSMSSLTCTELILSEYPSTIPPELQVVDRLTTNEQRAIIKKVKVAIATVLTQINPSSRKLWWRTSSKEKGVAIFRAKDGKRGLMGQSIVNFEPRKIYKALLDPWFRKAYDPMLKSLRVVEEFGDLKVLHMEHATKNCSASFRRDLLVAVRGEEVGSRFVVVGFSTTHPRCPESLSMKRVNVALSGWVVEKYRKRPGQSLVSLILDIDFRQLPKKVVRLVSKAEIMAIYDLAKAIKDRDDRRK